MRDGHRPGKPGLVQTLQARQPPNQTSNQTPEPKACLNWTSLANFWVVLCTVPGVPDASWKECDEWGVNTWTQTREAWQFFRCSVVHKLQLTSPNVAKSAMDFCLGSGKWTSLLAIIQLHFTMLWIILFIAFWLRKGAGFYTANNSLPFYSCLF